MTQLWPAGSIKWSVTLQEGIGGESAEKLTVF